MISQSIGVIFSIIIIFISSITANYVGSDVIKPQISFADVETQIPGNGSQDDAGNNGIIDSKHQWIGIIHDTYQVCKKGIKAPKFAPHYIPGGDIKRACKYYDVKVAFVFHLPKGSDVFASTNAPVPGDTESYSRGGYNMDFKGISSISTRTSYSDCTSSVTGNNLKTIMRPRILMNDNKFYIQFEGTVRVTGTIIEHGCSYERTSREWWLNFGDNVGGLGERLIPFPPGSLSLRYPDSCTNDFDNPCNNLSVKIIGPSFDPCLSNESPTMEHYHKGPWSFNYVLLNGQGLVLTDIRAGNQHLFDSISVPHLKIEYGPGFKNSQIVRFCSDNDPSPTYFTPLGHSDSLPNEDPIDNVGMAFTKTFNGQGGLKGVLHFGYDVVIGLGRTNCEANTYPCHRFIPQTYYSWEDKSGSQPVIKLTAFYKLDYGSKVGFATTHDEDNAVKLAIMNTGRQALLTHEAKFNAVIDGKIGEIDNIHTVHPGESVFLPGCRYGTQFDCVHMHWRWSESRALLKVDPMVNPRTNLPVSAGTIRGTPYLVPGQTINIAVVNYHPGEEDPEDPFTLVNNNEQIATARSIRGPLGCFQCMLTSAPHPIVWYIASSTSNSIYNGVADNTEFFQHGFFVIDTTGVIPPSLLPHASLDGQTTPSASPSSTRSVISALLVAQNQSVTAVKDNSINITLSATNADPNADLSAYTVSMPSHGNLGDIDQKTGVVTYTPQSGFTGLDSFTFKVNDGKSDSQNVATVNILIK